MWESNEKTALSIGLDLETYWRETPKQFEKHLDVYFEREKQKAREMDVNNYNLGKYIAIAFNDPKKYPKKPFLADKMDDTKEQKVMTNKEMEKTIFRNNIILGGKNNGIIREH